MRSTWARQNASKPSSRLLGLASGLGLRLLGVGNIGFYRNIGLSAIIGGHGIVLDVRKRGVVFRQNLKTSSQEICPQRPRDGGN